MEGNLAKNVTHHHDTYPFISPSKFTGSHTGKVVLITGASRGIGRATALAFAAAGADVAILARTAEQLEQLAGEIRKEYGVKVLVITGDLVTDDAGKIVKGVEEKLGKIDVLINNAGATRMARFAEESSLSLWWRIMEINVRAQLSLIHALLPSFSARGKGTILTVGSNGADDIIPHLSSYCASKAAIQKAIQVLELEFRELGVVSYVVQPGHIATTLADGPEAATEGEMRETMNAYLPYMADKVEVAADGMVALSALTDQGNEELKSLSGRYIDLRDDLGELLEKTKGKKTEIEEERLCVLTMKKF